MLVLQNASPPPPWILPNTVKCSWFLVDVLVSPASGERQAALGVLRKEVWHRGRVGRYVLEYDTISWLTLVYLFMKDILNDTVELAAETIRNCKLNKPSKLLFTWF